MDTVASPPRVAITACCVYCLVTGQPLEGDGYRKHCRDQAACARRVAANQPAPSKPSTARKLTVVGEGADPTVLHPVKTNSSTAEALIDLMQRRSGADTLSGPFQLGETLSLPLRAIQVRSVLFGKSGTGKTHASAVITENCLLNRIPVATFDMLGNLWGLRFAGIGAGLPIPILGGEHGDLELNVWDGPAVAGIFARGISMLIDLSLFTRDGQQSFCAEFFTEALRRVRIPAHVVVEEAETVCPAFSRSKTQFAAQGAVTLFARQIRNFGVGWTFSTQRMKLLHPDVADASSAFFAMQSTGDLAHRTIGNEARTRVGKVIAGAILNELGQLGRGEAWLLPDPSWLGAESSAPIRFKFRQRQTFDSAAVPTLGAHATQPGPPVAVDLRPFASLTPPPTSRNRKRKTA